MVKPKLQNIGSTYLLHGKSRTVHVHSTVQRTLDTKLRFLSAPQSYSFASHVYATAYPPVCLSVTLGVYVKMRERITMRLYHRVAQCG